MQSLTTGQGAKNKKQQNTQVEVEYIDKYSTLSSQGSGIIGKREQWVLEPEAVDDY